MARPSEGPWFRESKNGWYVTVDGRQVSLGVKGEGNRKDALKAWHRLMADGPEVKADAPKATPEPVPEVFTVRELVDAFLQDAQTRLKPNTVRIYAYDLGTLCRVAGTVPADGLTSQHLVKWLAGLKVGPTTRGMTLRSASACLGWAVRNDMIPVNPARKVPKPKGRTRTGDAIISEADHVRLTDAAPPGFRLVLDVLHGTGCRPSEAAGLTVENTDTGAGVAVLNTHKSDRTGKPRLVFLPPALCERLKALGRTSGAFLRTAKGNPWTGRSITQAMGRACKAAGLHAIAYGYRHAFATEALSRGVPDAQVAALLGHTSTAVLHKHYAHLGTRADVLRQAAALVRG